MWTNIESFRPFVESLQFAFTQPSFTTHGTLLLAWIMCLGRHRLIKVFQNSAPQFPVDNSQRHGFDTFVIERPKPATSERLKTSHIEEMNVCCGILASRDFLEGGYRGKSTQHGSHRHYSCPASTGLLPAPHRLHLAY